MKVSEIMAKLEAKYGNEKEYLQAVREVLESIEEVYNQHPEFEKARFRPTSVTGFSSTLPLAPTREVSVSIRQLLLPC